MKRLSPPDHVYSCNSCRAGHDVHFIQSRLSWEDPRAPVPGHIREVRQDGMVIVEDSSGHVFRLWNHDPERLDRLTLANDYEITMQLGLQLIKTNSSDGKYLFCVCPEEFRTPCGRRRLRGVPQSGQLVSLPANFDELSAAEQDLARHRLAQMIFEGIVDQRLD